MENISVALLCTVLGFSLSFLTFQKNSKKETESKATEQAEIKARLEYISQGIDDIRIDNKARDKQLNDINKRLIIAEEEIKTIEKKLG